MNEILTFAIHNMVFAFVLAAIVFVVCRVIRNPPLAHLLWLLVLVKFVAPMLVEVPLLNAQVIERIDSTTTRDSLTSPSAAPFDFTAISEAPLSAKADSTKSAWALLVPTLIWTWMIGSALLGLLTLYRIVRFEQLLKHTLPASTRMRDAAARLAGQMGVRHVPDVRYVQSIRIPLVWCATGKPKIVLPMQLVQDLDENQLEMVVAHELAHLRRRDHWVRYLELFVTILYWWNPVVWFVRRRLHETEDQCCDAWVREVIPNSSMSYAKVVLRTAESLSPSDFGGLLLPVSPFLRSVSLKERIEMIVERRFTPRLNRLALTFAIGCALVALPIAVQPVSGVSQENVTSEGAFPHVVDFEQGVTKFEDGDEIKITAIRGTAETFVPGHIYHIEGTYKLNSQNDATLAAYTTAMHSKDGTSRSWKVQTVRIKKGEGTFSLMLPMACEGWPHISFYSGSSFGGNYFGTGESVLKKWWGE